MVLCESSLEILSKDYDIPLDEVRNIVSNSPDYETVYFELEYIMKYKEIGS